MDAGDRGAPGASLLQEYERFAARAIGKREAAEVLTRSVGESVLFLFNRRLGADKMRGDIDIIAIAASGVFVLDPKAYDGKKIRTNSKRTAFVINGRKRPALADGMRRHLDVVRSAVEFGPIPDVRVSAAFCFIGSDLPWRLVVDGVPATTLRGAVKLLKRRGPLTAEQRQALHTHLSTQFPPA